MKKVDILFMLHTFDAHKEIHFVYKPTGGDVVELELSGTSWSQTDNRVDAVMLDKKS